MSATKSARRAQDEVPSIGDLSDKDKFRWETIRSIAFAAVSLFFAFLIVEPALNRGSKLLDVRSEVVSEYLLASYRYTSVAYDSFFYPECSKPHEHEQYGGASYDRYRSERNRMRVFFTGHEQVIEALDRADAVNEWMRVLRAWIKDEIEQAGGEPHCDETLYESRQEALLLSDEWATTFETRAPRAYQESPLLQSKVWERVRTTLKALHNEAAAAALEAMRLNE
jgi:hypothetical protein